MNTNGQIFHDFLASHTNRTQAVNIEWVLWAFLQIAGAERRGVLINPEYLRAPYFFPGDSEPNTIFFN